MRVPLPWLAESVSLVDPDPAAVAAALVKVGLEEEAIHTSGVTGPLVAGLVVAKENEPQKNGKMVNWCQVDVGQADGGVRGIICGADNFVPGDTVVVALPGAVLPGGFVISARKTYGHVSDGMICAQDEVGLGEDHTGIIVLSSLGIEATPGMDLIPLLHLDEATVEINVTPDRGYCFSVRGVAREYAHSTGQLFKDPALIDTPPATADGFGIEVQDDAPIRGRAGCDRFVARIVRGCNAAGPSPQWMQRRLMQAGMRPISLGVDVTNYVMLALGQPLHAYDLHQVAEPIVVRRAQPGERLVTLDDVERTLDPEDLLITDSPDGVGHAGRILGMAGVMGGASSEVSGQTEDLLVEAAHFDPITTARTARRHKLFSEAARRFERGVDPDLPPRAAQMVVDLLTRYGGGQADPAVTDYDQRPEPAAISFDPAYPAAIIGVDYATGDVHHVLEAIGCQVWTKGGHAVVHSEVGGVAGAGSWKVVPPGWRPDLTRAIDLVEEVGRIAGFGLITSVLPQAPAGPGSTKSQRLRRSVARALADFGLVEVLSYPFVGSAAFEQLGYLDSDVRRQAAALTNPLDSAAGLMRTALLQTLLAVARRNVGRGQTDLGLFELGLVTLPGTDQAKLPLPPVDQRPSPEVVNRLLDGVPAQPRHAAGVLLGQREPAGVWGPGRPVSWSDAVESARVVAAACHVPLVVTAGQDAPFHPGRCARLEAGGALVGYAGELHPQVCQAFGLPDRSVGFEVDVDALIALAPDVVPAVAVKTQPVAKEDLALVVDQAVTAEAVRSVVATALGELAESVQVFDVYTGDQVAEGSKSVAVALRLRAADHTLTPEEVTAARNRAVKAVAKQLSGTLRT